MPKKANIAFQQTTPLTREDLRKIEGYEKVPDKELDRILRVLRTYSSFFA
ncbi:MAG: hypothetical protein AAF570_11310 [Bacteroidota bacterium]